jgi:signal transduction histidine kinase
VRRIAVIFLVAVFVPSLVLGFLALRTAGEQRVILERQAAELYQKDADQLAAQLAEAVLGRQREFADRVRVLLSNLKPFRLAGDFGNALGPHEPGTAFVVGPDGAVVAAQMRTREDARFLRENEAFLSNRASAEFFPTQQNTLNYLSNTAPLANATQNALQGISPRRVQPQKNVDISNGQDAQVSRVASLTSRFQTATSGASDGVLARFSQNELVLILWTRPPEADGYVFGLALPTRTVRAFVRKAFSAIDPKLRNACIAVLDENALPVATSELGFQGDWKHPFVASEIGETLPHWETVVYLLHPDQLVRSARLVALTLILLIALALAAILAGGSFVALDARRQLLLAQQKTDFVSNVSHELKTPLTSIRMFAELLEDDRVPDPAKRARYLRIIALESERLTRLINNVLDFARSGKKHKIYRKTVVDLRPVIERAWEAQSVHLRDAGFACEWIADDPPYPAHADADAIGQVLVNLLSNAEKYAGDQKEITLHARRAGAEIFVEVLDRGIGVPKGDENRIFEAFHRSNDSLASNVQGTGLGLTLARRIAEDHGGSLEYRSREGGGSVFTLRLPLAEHTENQS